MHYDVVWFVEQISLRWQTVIGKYLKYHFVCMLFLNALSLVAIKNWMCAGYTSIHRSLWYFIVDSKVWRLHTKVLQSMSCGLTKGLHGTVYVLLPDE